MAGVLLFNARTEAFVLCLNPDNYSPESSWFASQAPPGSTGAHEGQSPNLYDRHKEGSGRQLTPEYFAAPPSPPEERPSCAFSCPCPQPFREACPTHTHPPTQRLQTHPCWAPMPGACENQTSSSFVNVTRQPRIITFETNQKQERERWAHRTDTRGRRGDSGHWWEFLNNSN